MNLYVYFYFSLYFFPYKISRFILSFFYEDFFEISNTMPPSFPFFKFSLPLRHIRLLISLSQNLVFNHYFGVLKNSEQIDELSIIIFVDCLCKSQKKINLKSNRLDFHIDKADGCNYSFT
ncbi:hypothetical protein BpHYR1_044302 [Brachionus plicatilis]|uniref:Uncharacterized protein n=1 Tax=Brachionus plicatilis TaxID=10195 RepID=A0A3M7SAI6_BRAPC|nr:hypothetical protein BpHYR1_044302 [Brachionus plicatilis]